MRCRMSIRGSLPLLVCSGGVGLQEKYPNRLYSRYYNIYSIRLDLSLSSRYLLEALRCTPISVVRRKSWSCGLDRPWLCGPCPLPWVPRVIPSTATLTYSSNFGLLSPQMRVPRPYFNFYFLTHCNRSPQNMHCFSQNTIKLMCSIQSKIV
jgi:hypothetical protein